MNGHLTADAIDDRPPRRGAAAAPPGVAIMSAQQKRQERFDRVMRAHGAGLSRVAASYSRSSQEREDLAQEIALAVWRALPRFRGDCTERTFVFRIAHNRGISLMTKRRPPVLGHPPETIDPRPDPEEAASASQARARLLAAIGSLPLSYQQVLTLALEGMPHGEIASVLGISENNVAVRLNRARAALRAALEIKR